MAASPDVEVALAAVGAGAQIVRSTYGRALSIHAKTGIDFATNADIEAERAILDVITAALPDDAIVGEESGRSGGTATTRRWLVDPLCGTLNFAAQTPLVAVNVALIDGSRTVAAAVADPIAGDVYWTDGKRAMVRAAGGADVAMSPSPRSRLVDVNCDGPLDRPFLGAQVIDAAFRTVFGPRVISTTLAVAWVASGGRAGYISDGHFLDNLHFAAGIELCRAAGCVVSDFNGAEVGMGRGLIIGADAPTHHQLLSIVAAHVDRLA